MKSTQRHAAAAAGFFALSLAGTAVLAQQQPAQRGGPPNEQTPYILVSTFHSNDRALGVEMADELRKRLQSEHAARELYVIPANNIKTTLEASGYRPDSALNASDLMELAKSLRGEEVIDGTANKTANGIHVETRLLMKSGSQTLSQPLPPIDAKDAGDAAKTIERNLTTASKALPAYKKCLTDLRAQKNDDALADAQQGLTAYAQSSFARVCQLNALANKKASADEIINAATGLRAVDPTSMMALANLAEAYKTKGDTNKVIETNLAIYRLDPSNSALAGSIVNDLANSGAPDKALPIVDSLLKDNPADPQMLQTKWKLQLRAGQFKNAIATGEELAKVDTAIVNADFYTRMIGAAQSDSNPAKVQELAAKASQKFPNDATYPLLLAQAARKAGQAQQALAYAEKAAQVDPKNANAWLLAIFAANDLKQADTSLALAQRAIAAGVDKQQIGSLLLQNVNASFQKAQASKTREDYEAALKDAETVDAIAASPTTKFFIGVASYSIAADILGNVQTLAKSQKKDDHAQACVQAKQAEDYLAKTSIAMPAGGSVDAKTASQILGAVSQYSEYIGQIKKAFSCK